MSEKLHILVLEDEQRTGEKLIGMISQIHPEGEVTWLRSIREGIAYLQDRPHPDLIFSDIELLDGKAFEVFRQVPPRCPIIFCTAYDRFYLDAFQTNGIAYLLKPYNLEQLRGAWDKYQRLFGRKDESIPAATLRDLLQSLQTPAPPSYKQTFTVKRPGGIFLLKASEVAFFTAKGDFVVATDLSGKPHSLGHSLSDLESLTDPAQFFRINRSEMVGFGAIHKIEPYTKNRLAIVLKSGGTVLYTSNSRSPEFRAWLEQH